MVALGVGAVTATSGAGTADSSTALQENGDEEEITFLAQSQGGFVAFSEENAATAREEGVAFPVTADGDDPIQFTATVDEDGNWESTDTQFPEVTVQDGVTADVEPVDGLSGIIDPENDEMTLEGTIEVTVNDNSFQFDIQLTSESSGELQGNADFSSEPGEVTLVDNEYLVTDTTDSWVDNALELPADSEGENWYELVLDVDLDGDELTQPDNGDSSDSGSEADEEESGTDLALTVTGQAFGIVGLAGAAIFMLLSLIARAGVISLES